MTLIAKTRTQTYLCLQHQKEYRQAELVLVVMDKPSRECPLCAEDMPAEFAKEIGGKYGICVLHEQEGEAAVARCSVCHNSFCGDCMSAGDACGVCAAMPYGTT